MELLVVIAWAGLLAYIAKVRTETIQLHLLIAWALMALSALIAFIHLLLNWLRT